MGKSKKKTKNDLGYLRSYGFSARICKAYAEAEQRFLDLPFVTAIDVGSPCRNGRLDDEEPHSIRIHVREKRPREVLTEDTIIPNEIGGIRTDVIQANYVGRTATRPSPPRGRAFKKIQPGISVSAAGLGSGTIGAIAYDVATGAPGVLSNWHVLAGFLTEPDSKWPPIIQPGTTDRGRVAKHTIGRLQEFILDARGDAAFAILNKQKKFLPYQFGSGVWLRSWRKVRDGDRLSKSGRTTAVTSGRVEGVGKYEVYYPTIGRGRKIYGFKLVHPLHRNPRNEEISDDGDSGGIWYDPESRRAVGLLMAGEREDQRARHLEHSLACHIGPVLEALKISLTPPAE